MDEKAPDTASKDRFKKFSLITLIYTLTVILWGAWVRFSHSGDGCGNRWPLCGDQLLPENTMAWIEWIHRFTSGLSLLLVGILWFVSLKIYPKKHLIRKCSATALILILIEALIGAVLVLASLTGSDSSTLRALVLSLHLLNSLALTGSLVFCRQGAFASHIQIKKACVLFFTSVSGVGAHGKSGLTFQHPVSRRIPYTGPRL